ncbi:MAG: DNA repair protein RecO [Waddliaceae bacterium]|jgi:recombinational DNA repair protein (RecF pathway)|nr:DNA repair protein RecO [Waddliaceae bacterium]MBT3578900.1 DNA repair protein RecO [Waddliaceae bacterium]MBT4445024.1 DNA repair protein RecO [Waddliaceae bacterium]MBT6929032.1 DNA repair protein RecO [Waddliaceae bacterium]MBT7264031.1 DNA repair protein RecO [Waddliaceae bacterium]
MNAEKHRVEGITIHSFDFKEYDRIITVFSSEMGVISLIVKGANRRKKGTASALATPLSCGEFIFSAGKGDLFTYHDGTIYDQFLSLRNDFDTLDAAGEMLKIVKSSLLPMKPSPLLYLLLKTFLSGFGGSENPRAVLVSFILKVLCHEGLLSIDPEIPYIQWLRDNGNSEIPFSEDEYDTILCLALSRSLQQISSLHVPKNFEDKVKALLAYNY